MNDTMNSYTLLPFLLTIRVLSRFHAVNTTFPNAVTRFRVIDTSRKKMETMMWELRISHSFRSVGHHKTTVHSNVEIIYSYMETEKQSNERDFRNSSYPHP